MRRSLYLVLVSLSLFCCVKTTVAQNAKIDFNAKDLIIGIPDVSEKTLADLILVTSALKNVVYYQYCPDNQLVILKYDPEVYPEPDRLIKDIIDRGFGLRMFRKEGSAADLHEVCY